nr:immunoglobulin light chain junction region [Macaca mulatta]MOV66855.1 immunoglobulin light chain junction region [Macaca mulatta]MOV67594.1 immunoglobulin light chain junction region [Macaca mulatta]MOV68736.1 immunoglobulin light chain junction region [Macaca mulatta]MOV69145.1 immunoglobulin light chain junction region [Macaca mulatta]
DYYCQSTDTSGNYIF